MASRKSTRKPKQARAIATVDAIVEAAARIVIDDGYDALSTNRIAKRAGVSVGTLYQYFDDKDAVVSELVERQVSQMQTSFSRALAERPVPMPESSFEEEVRRVLDASMEAMLVRPELFTRLLREAPHARREELDRRWRQRYTELLAAALRAGDSADRDVGLVAHVLVTAVYGVVADAMAHRPELMTSPALRDELCRLAVAYLA